MDRFFKWLSDNDYKIILTGLTMIIVGLSLLMGWMITVAKEECEATGDQWDTDTYSTTVIMANGSVGTGTATNYECERGN